MDFRTDLAIEIKESLPQKTPEGIKTATFQKNGAKITKIKIANKNGADAIGKPQGTYITAEIPNLTKYSCTDEGILSMLGELLSELLPSDGTVLTVGLGNENITPDALGPLSCSMVLATRHISGELARSVGLEGLRPSAVQSPGVLGQTGVESAEIIKGIVKQINPSAVIVIDALAARKLSRLGCTVQMSDTGIIPGSGVGNSRAEISKQTLGVPVISIGVPTVVDAKTLVHGIMGEETPLEEENQNMIITPREIDLVIDRAARLVGMAVNKALQPHISTEEMLMLVTAS
ncbi:MAG: GPR endopeptidase [Clostridia bacterium]|nr:GPR endopeptidase [Clostridia bacterium]